MSTAPQHSRFEVTDPDAAREAMLQMYPGIRMSHTKETVVRFGVDKVTAGPIRIDRARQGLAGRAVADPIDYLLPIIPLAGSIRLSAGGHHTRFGPKQPLLCPVGIPVDFSWTNAFDEVLVPMSLAAVEQSAAAAFGIEAEDLRFLSPTPVSVPMSHHWRATVNYVAREIYAHDSALAHPLLQARTAEMLAASVLATFPNTALLADHTAGPGKVAPAAIRRAIAFIDANADKPITVSDIALAANIGPRGLQSAFRRHTGVTPMRYLRRVRLERAHRELQAADPTTGTTVKAIAARWGFTNRDRFAALYRDEFGALPSHTLRT